MISKELFKKIEKEYGDVASWAVWGVEGDTPKSNMGDLSIFDLQKNPLLLEQLNNNVVMVALNFARPLVPVNPFKNFHDEYSSANDFKIRYAFRDTEFYGAYMTDIIKNLEDKDSNNVKEAIRKNQNLVDENMFIFRRELSIIESKKPIILAFGSFTYELLNNNLRKDEYSKLIKLPHYSKYISKENFKTEVLKNIHEVIEYSSDFTQTLKTAQCVLKEQSERIEKGYNFFFNNNHSQYLKDVDEKLLSEIKNISEELIKKVIDINFNSSAGMRDTKIK